MYKRIATAAMFMALLTSPTVDAQTEPDMTLIISAVGGLTAPTGAYSDEWKQSASYGLEIDYMLAPEWAVTGTGSYGSAEARFTSVTDKAKVIELSGGMKYIISPTPTVKPHVRFSLGLYNRDVGSSTTETNFGVSGGGGIDLYLPNSPIGFSGVARIHKIFITSTSTQTGDWEFFHLWAGVRLKVM